MSTEGGAGLPGTTERVLSWCVIAVAKTVQVAARGLAPVLRPILRRIPPDPSIERTWKNAEHLISNSFRSSSPRCPPPGTSTPSSVGITTSATIRSGTC